MGGVELCAHLVLPFLSMLNPYFASDFTRLVYEGHPLQLTGFLRSALEVITRTVFLCLPMNRHEFSFRSSQEPA